MTPKQEQHLKDILYNSLCLIDKKYRAGQKEKGDKDNLFDKTAIQLCDETIAELVDGLVYQLSLRDKLNGRNQRAIRSRKKRGVDALRAKTTI